VKIFLETRCGCRREVEWSEVGGEIAKPTKHFNVLLMPGFPFAFDGRSWYRRFTQVGFESGAVLYREMRLSPVWTAQELHDGNGPTDIVFDSSMDEEK
jgi:hypothetical protein